MSKTDIRLGSIISFDTEREADIIEFVQDLTSQHKLGRFLGYLLRLACETPEVLHYREKTQPILKEMELLGVTPKRDEMFKKYNNDLLELKRRIDDLYEMAEKLYTLAIAGKALGLEERSEELLAAQFVVRHQTALIEQKLGRDSILYMYKSNSMQDAKKKAEDNLDMIISAYGDIFSELKQAIAKVKSLEIEQISAKSINVENAAGTFIAAQPSSATAQPSSNNTQDKNTAPKESKAENKDDIDELTALNESPFDIGVTEFKANDSLMAMLGDFD